MYNLQQNHHNRAKLLREFQFYTSGKSAGNKSATGPPQKFHWPAEWP